jgi:hypothetical protein
LKQINEFQIRPVIDLKIISEKDDSSEESSKHPD